MKYAKVQEEELKNKVARNFFGKFDCTEILEKIDFTVKSQTQHVYFLWAEAKAAVTDICAMLTQLILTIGKARTFDRITPPPFLGCFDREKIAFVPYHSIQGIFYQSDFNWKVTPSNKDTREFKLVYDLVNTILSESPEQTFLFDFQKDEKELQNFIKTNFVLGKADTTKVPIDKNNFVTIYIKWLETVKPTIHIDWDKAKKSGIIDGDFYLADLLSIDNKTLKEKLYVLLKSDYYELDRKVNDLGLLNASTASFLDNQRAHTQFWAKYERPPLEEYWDYIVERRDLLVPQDVRERKGSFFTPRIWVELSQRYIADVLGKDWQDEYYVWDCAAGTGNLLAGLTNKYHIWASTIDRADVDVMKDRIRNGANLLEDHVFQLDFLNDDFTKLPEDLRDVIEDENKRKKLVIYINPPCAEASNRATVVAKGENKSKVATETKIYQDFMPIVGTATREVFAQFFLRVYKEIPQSILASFSTLKYANSQYFCKFRDYFKARFRKGFMCQANSFDNVKGNFPIGFSILDLAATKRISKIVFDVYEDGKGANQAFFTGKKNFYAHRKGMYIIDWLKQYHDKQGGFIAYLRMQGTDYANNQGVFIANKLSENDIKKTLFTTVTKDNLITTCVYFTVRKIIDHTWINHNDQFLFPNDGWKADREFRYDCLAYTLFQEKNNIQSKHGINHWIPFTEAEVNARSKFKSNFMTDFIAGKIERTNGDLFSNGKKQRKIIFSAEAKAVFNAGRALWRYYHSQKKMNVNASLYDIREHFQGRNDKGKMNNKSDDETYNELIGDLRSALKILAKKIEPKVYEYGFLKK
jgi:hypothetical protein